jgi:hypothetical protein
MCIKLQRMAAKTRVGRESAHSTRDLAITAMPNFLPKSGKITKEEF